MGWCYAGLRNTAPALVTRQVAFHSDRNVRKYVVMEKDKETLRRLAKTKDERCGGACMLAPLLQLNHRCESQVPRPVQREG